MIVEQRLSTKVLYFCLNAGIQFCWLMLSYYFSLQFYQQYFGAQLDAMPLYLSFLGVFLSVYFTLMWKELYSHEIHCYLMITGVILVNNLAAALLAVLLVVLLELVFIQSINLIFWKVLVFFSFAVFMILGLHAFFYLWLSSLSAHGYFHKKVMLVGKSSERFHVEHFFQDMGNSKEFCGTLHLIKKGNCDIWEWDKRRTWDPNYRQTPAEPREYKHFMDVIYENHIGEVILFLGPNISEKVFENIINFCRENAIGYYVVPDISTMPKTKYWDNLFSYVPIIVHGTTNRDNLFNITIKRIFDIFVSLSILLVFLPLGLVISLIIFLCDFGPVFYISKRVGKDGQAIPFFKFRTMRPDAEQLKEALWQQNERKGDGPLFKIKNDPRVTRFGRFLRHTSLDEFPQFLNVLLGHLSIVGPRPHLPEEVEYYRGKDFMRLECMPGITCLPQLRDRNHMGYHEWLALDQYYRKNWSLARDFYIFWHTGLLFLRSFWSRPSSNSKTDKAKKERF